MSFKANSGVTLSFWIKLSFYRATLCISSLCYRPVSVWPSGCHVGGLYQQRWRLRQTSFSAPVAPSF